MLTTYSGIIHIVLVALSHTNFFGHRNWNSLILVDRNRPNITEDGDTKSVLPIPCHSHNDYTRNVPLFDALHAGCTSVEADIWLVGSNKELQVGHNKASLSPSRTLESLYLRPLVRLLDRV